MMHGITAIECNSPTIVGFFVYRHLGLLGCNIVLMKRFLPLFILTGLLFGQDILNLKNGEFFEGTFHEKLGRDILFKAVGDTTMKKFPIWNVETIETKNWGELTYPFDIPTKEVFSQNTKSNVFNLNILPKNFVSKQEIINMSEDEKDILYRKYKVNPFGNTIISFFVPTLGYYRINQWKKRGRNCTCIYLASGMVLQLRVGTDNMTKEALGHPEERRDVNKIGESFAGIFIALHLFDVYNQTKKYNGNLYQYIFGQKAP